MQFIFQLLLVLLLVFLNGFFVASEFALVSVRKTRIKELVKKGRKRAKLVQLALNDIDTYISSTQLGITIASLALGWIGEPAIANFLMPLFNFLPQSAGYVSSHTIAVITSFLLITFLHIVLGEVAPKTMALQRSEAMSFFVIVPLILFTKIFNPFIFLLNSAGGIVLKILGFKVSSKDQLVHTEEEIKMIVAQSVAGGAFNKNDAEMVSGVFKFGDITIKQIMIPRTDVIALNVATTLENMIKKVTHHPHSRFPVYEGSIDTIVGFVHIKDIYRALIQGGKNRKISELDVIRDIITVPEIKRIDEVLLEMRKKRIHISIIEDEYGGTAGIATLEDIIESLVGEIHDEFEQPQSQISKQKDGSYLIDGLTPLEKIQTRFTLPVKGQGYTTVGGLIFGILGREAKRHDIVQLGDVSLRVEEMAKNRIKTIKLKKEIAKK